MRRRGVSSASAARATYSRRGPWWQSNSGALQAAYSNKWFESHLLSLNKLWYHRRHDWYATKSRST